MFNRFLISIVLVLNFSDLIFAGEIKNNFSPALTWAGRIFDFLGVVFILVYFLRKPTIEFFRERTKRIKKEIGKAEKLEREIVEKLDGIKTKMELLDEEIAKIKDEYEKNAESLEKRIMEETEVEMERARMRAEREIENMVKKGMEELKKYAALKSIELSEKMLKERMNKGEKERFFEEIIATLEKKN